MSLAVRHIDPWNLLWVMPAKGTRCHHTFTFSPRSFFRLSCVIREKCACMVALDRMGFRPLLKGTGRRLPGFSWSLAFNPSKQKEGSPHEEKWSQRDKWGEWLGAASPYDHSLACFA